MDGKRLEKRDWEEREGLGLCEAKGLQDLLPRRPSPPPPPRFPFLIVMGSGGRAVRGHFIISRKKSLLTGGYFGGRKKTIK